MASCSKHTQPEPEFEPWVKDLSLPVPIQFGTPDVAQTKALPVDQASDLAGRWLGVFAINNDSGADWSESKNILLKNASATYNNGAVQFIGSSTDDVLEKYYPVKSDINYTFYGYYVQTDATLSSTNSVPEVQNGLYYVNVYFGSLDYLWAKSVAETYETYNGYNAKYIREITKANKTEFMPKFNFKHITSSIAFVAKGDSEDSTNNDDFKDIQICSIRVNKAVKTAKLCIADKGEVTNITPVKEGSFFDIQDAEEQKGDILLRATKGDSYVTWLPDGDEKPIPTIEGTSIGQNFFLCPGYQYSITVVYKSNASNNSAVELQIPMTPQLEAGKKYVYTLVFHKSTKVDITVTLQDWQSGASNEIADLN